MNAKSCTAGISVCDGSCNREWVQITPSGWWATWLSCQDGGQVISGSGVTYTGTLPDGRTVARTFDGREWTQVRVRA